jgi:hypothetical protein
MKIMARCADGRDFPEFSVVSLWLKGLDGQMKDTGW